ncbi:MAG: hypothetical protein ACI9KE_005508 [Polyangiales bacterium]
MSAYYTEVVWAPILLALLLCVGWGYFIPAIVQRLAPGASPRAYVAAAFGVFVVAQCVGFHSVGPTLVDSPMPLFGSAVGVLAAGVCLLRRKDAVRGAPSGLSVDVLALLLAVSPALIWLAALRATSIDDATTCSQPHAEWRQVVDPWDPDVHLSLAWWAVREDDADRGAARLDVARRTGVAQAPASELQAEILAMKGDCDGAREAFETALSARANAALETLDLRLEDAYRLPERFVRECGLTPEDSTTP